MYPDPIAYTYDADHHCPACAEARFGRTDDGFIAGQDDDGSESTDSEGNPVGVIAPWDSWCQEDNECETLSCSTCGGEIDTAHAYPHSPGCDEYEPGLMVPEATAYLAVLDITFTREAWGGPTSEGTGYSVTDVLPHSGPGTVIGEWEETGSCEDRTVKMVAELAPEQWQTLIDEWSLEPDDSIPNGGTISASGHLDSFAFGFDGMDWNVGGRSEVTYVSLYVSPLVPDPNQGVLTLSDT